jgi:hypothetical protein
VEIDETHNDHLVVSVHFGGDIKMDTFEDTSHRVKSWFHTNVIVHEKKKKDVYVKSLLPQYKGKKVIGYICGDEPPQ